MPITKKKRKEILGRFKHLRKPKIKELTPWAIKKFELALRPRDWPKYPLKKRVQKMRIVRQIIEFRLGDKSSVKSLRGLTRRTAMARIEKLAGLKDLEPRQMEILNNILKIGGSYIPKDYAEQRFFSPVAKALEMAGIVTLDIKRARRQIRIGRINRTKLVACIGARRILFPEEYQQYLMKRDLKKIALAKNIKRKRS